VEVLVSAASHAREGSVMPSGKMLLCGFLGQHIGAAPRWSDHTERPLSSWDEDILRPRALHVQAAHFSWASLRALTVPLERGTWP
jgi:hypothetical protein